MTQVLEQSVRIDAVSEVIGMQVQFDLKGQFKTGKEFRNYLAKAINSQECEKLFHYQNGMPVNDYSSIYFKHNGISTVGEEASANLVAMMPLITSKLSEALGRRVIITKFSSDNLYCGELASHLSYKNYQVNSFVIAKHAREFQAFQALSKAEKLALVEFKLKRSIAAKAKFHGITTFNERDIRVTKLGDCCPVLIKTGKQGDYWAASYKSVSFQSFKVFSGPWHVGPLASRGHGNITVQKQAFSQVEVDAAVMLKQLKESGHYED